MKILHRFTAFSVLLSFVAVISACSDGPSESGPSKMSLPRISVKSGLNQETGTIRFQVNVPQGHHAYTDTGDSGNLIPVTFQWENLHKETGLNLSLPELVTDPPGSRDEEFQARVLRGSGTFEFKAEDVQKYSGKTLSVRSQICDEKTGICYRPETVQVTLTN